MFFLLNLILSNFSVFDCKRQAGNAVFLYVLQQSSREEKGNGTSYTKSFQSVYSTNTQSTM